MSIDSGSSELAGRWRCQMVLKLDVFSTIERGQYLTPHGEVESVLRRIDAVPWWARPLARHLFRRERNALERIGDLDVGPRLLYANGDFLVRGFIEGVLDFDLARIPGQQVGCWPR